MKTSDPSAYQHIEQITASSTSVLNFRGLYPGTATATIAGTTWEKDSAGNWKTFSGLIIPASAVFPFSPRTISSISGTVYGLR
jgi:hypothetical protein